MRALRIYTLSYPFALVAGFFVTWYAGRASLGHWPRPSIDDPGQIGGWFEVPFTVTSIVLGVGFPGFVVAVAALVSRAYRDSTQRARLLTTAAIAVLLMVGAIFYLHWDPLRIGYWFLD